ncbi:S8 family serine peptidase [Nonomuraea purpurea]|uniref:S8 family serine peptidase n=1 Tax=Nonomuraea purpurea TaxID=1849276 RepID=A0ABV8GQ29_9ACTN
MTLGSALMAAMLAGTLGITAVHEPEHAARETGSVTLVTGDRVIVTGQGYRVEPGQGRQVRFATQRRDGHLLVVPSDALPLVARGVLDERLFDVTQLLQWRYGDADTAEIPVIAQGPAPRAARQDRRLPKLGMTALRIPKAGTAQTWKELTSGSRSAKTKLWLDGRRSFSLDQSVKQIGATEAWKQGMTGEGVTVAVLDSGYDPDHPDLKGVVRQARNFSDAPDTSDNLGHGTHVASIIAGAGQKYRGVAPDAGIAVGKVGDDTGIRDSALLAGMEWAAAEVKAKVVNMSIGGPDGLGLDPLEEAVNTLSAQTGALFVISAGNNGGAGTVSSPGSADAALTVGAVDREDQVAGFSSTGPRADDHAIKPDVTAPGVGIVAAAAKGTADGPYVAYNGTSMAAPHVAGAAAILAQRHPEWTGQQLKAALIGSAKPTGDTTPFEQGAGRVDLVRALAQPVTAQPGNVWADFPWNGSGERETTTSITYTNAGDAPVTLDLTAEGETLKLPVRRLEVPAGGQASVALVIDAKDRGPGDYPGTVTARSGETVIRTLAGAYVEPESYDVTITAIARDGRPSVAFGEIYNLETGARHGLFFKDGEVRTRLPKGEWNVYADLFEGSGSTTAHVPLKIDGDEDLVLDARLGKQIRFSVDEPTAVADSTLELNLSNGSWSFGWLDVSASPDKAFFVLPVRQPGLRYMTKTVWHKKDAAPSPYRYDLVDYHTDGIPDDPAYDARTSDLVKVTATNRGPGTAAKATVLLGTIFPGFTWPFLTPTPDVDLPGTLTSYRSPGFTWDTEFRTGTATLVGSDRYLKARSHNEMWNAAVTGPAFATSGGSRTGDDLTFSAARLFTDGVAGRTGTDASVTGALTLSKGEEKLAETDLAGCSLDSQDTCLLSARVPSDAAVYTLRASARRNATLSTAVESLWTFESANTSQEQPLPLTAVRYAPAGLDAANRAKPGTTTKVPLWIERNPGSRAASVRSVRLEASFDDGETWRAVPVHPASSGWTARIANPGTPGFVSLRATVTSTAGERTTQTITRAYAVG